MIKKDPEPSESLDAQVDVPADVQNPEESRNTPLGKYSLKEKPNDDEHFAIFDVDFEGCDYIVVEESELSINWTVTFVMQQCVSRYD